MYTSIWWYLRVLPVLHTPEVVDIWCLYYIEKHAICLKDYRIRSVVNIHYVYGDLCKHLGIDSSTDLKHLGIDSSTDHPDRYSNPFLNAYINRHVHAENLKKI